MNNPIQIVLTTLAIILSLLLTDVEAQGQDPITEYNGIPLIIYPERDANAMTDSNFTQMKDMGVFGVLGGNVLPGNLTVFQEQGLKVLPWYSDSSAFNHIYNYTDAHYTVWEAEGTDPEKGRVTLYHSEYASISQDGKSVKAEGPNVPDGETIILGPGYPQNGTYRLGGVFVRYSAEYSMKIEQRDPELPQDFLDDVVCTIMVTNLDETFTEDTVIYKQVKVSDFNGWDNWKEIQMSDTGYTLQGYATASLQGPMGTDTHKRAYCIQFKIIWAGLDYLNLYIDKIRVYDDKGIDLMEGFLPGSRIDSLVTSYISNSTIIGWYGIDEPPSIDNYEPYRVVDSIINATSNGQLRLHARFTSGWKGTYGHLSTGAHKFYCFEEFWLRAKIGNIRSHLAKTITHTKK